MEPTPTPQPAGWLARNWHYIALMVTLSGWAVTVYVALRDGKPIPPPPVIESQPAAPGPMGWEDRPEEVRKFAATLQFPTFAQPPAGADANLPDKIFQWEICKAATGSYLPTLDQGSVGSCTAFGGVGAGRIQLCVRIVTAKKAMKPAPDYWELATEPLYGLARVDVLGGVLRGSDGATGSSVAQAAQKYGFAPRQKYATVDLSSYSQATCRRMGDSGVPADIKEECAKHKTNSVTLVRTTEDVRRALANGFSVTIASNVGFGNRGPYVRDQDGCLRASGTWAHQMHLIGYAKHPTRGYLFCIMNSWGENWVGGPKGAGDPPSGSFWCVEQTMQRILDAGDSWVFDGIGGFERKPLDWAMAEPQKRFGINDSRLAIVDRSNYNALAP